LKFAILYVKRCAFGGDLSPTRAKPADAVGRDSSLLQLSPMYVAELLEEVCTVEEDVDVPEVVPVVETEVEERDNVLVNEGEVAETTTIEIEVGLLTDYSVLDWDVVVVVVGFELVVTLTSATTCSPPPLARHHLPATFCRGVSWRIYCNCSTDSLIGSL
jgi:hypothetical protein